MAILTSRPDKPFRIAVFAVYAVLLIVGILFHEMWRDEVQAWLIVRESHSFADLIRNLRYEGHPALWYVLLSPFSLLGRQPEWMQVLQAAVALSTVWLILWRGPFTRLELALLPFGYVFLFEYGIKSRSYSVGAFLILLFCAAYGLRRKRPEILGLILGLAANVQVLYALAGMAGVIAIAYDRWRSRERPFVRMRDIAALALLGLGLVLSVITAFPPPDSGYAVEWRFDAGIEHIYSTLRALSVLVYRVEIEARRWTFGGIAFVLYLLSRWRVAPVAWVFFFTAVGSILAFIHVKFGPFAWHHSVLFVVLVAAIWISRYEEGVSGPSLVPKTLFALVLIGQIVSSGIAYTRDAFLPYSNGKAIAHFIESNNWAGQPVYSLNDFIGSTVVGFLGAPSFHYAQAARQGSFVIWDKARLEPIDVNSFLRLAKAEGNATVLDCDAKWSEALLRFGFIEVARFDHSITGENCVVYRANGPVGG